MDNEVKQSPETKENAQENEIEMQLNEEINLLKDQLLRALAEAENIRKRADREKSELGKYAITNFARDLLPVADNLALALRSIDPHNYKDDSHVHGLISGIQLTEQTLHTILEKNGIQKIYPLNQKFDSHFHQAMTEIVQNDVEPGIVVEVYQPGYLIHDRLLRPAMVAVSKKA